MDEEKHKRQRLNHVLRALWKASRLLIGEKDRKSLTQGICDVLIESGVYHFAWFALSDESGKFSLTAESGLGRESSLLVEQLKQGILTECAEKALTQSHVVLTENPHFTCKSCPLSNTYVDRRAIAVRVNRGKEIRGVLCLSTPVQVEQGEEECRLLEEFAGDVALGIHNMGMIEKRKRKEEELQHFAAIIASSDDAIIAKGLDGMITSWNEGAQRIYGYAREQVLDKPISILVPEDRHNEVPEILTKLSRGERVDHYETIRKRKDNSLVEVSLTVSPIRDDSGKIVGASTIARDITDQKEAEKRLRDSERRFRDLVVNSLIGISIIQNGQVVYQNSEQERLLGPLPRPSKLSDIESIYPDDVEKVKEFSQNMTTGNVRTQEMEFRFYETDQKGNKLGIKWVHCRRSLIEYQGKDAILVNMMDVTRAKEMEDALRLQDKMSSLGRVAAGIAHEIRNPLSGINIYLNTMERIFDRGDKPEQLKQIFKQLQSASNKIESVIRRVMDFSKPSEPTFVSIDINGPIEEAIDLSSVTLRKRGIKFEKNLTEDMPRCTADPQMIEQVILNLLTNAAEAMKNVEGEKRVGVTSLMENECITIRVFDSGPGVPFHVKEKVFDPFYTTKNGSTGIGLSLSHRIITDHGGFLKVYPSEWGGAEFRIEIPLARGTEQK